MLSISYAEAEAWGACPDGLKRARPAFRVNEYIETWDAQHPLLHVLRHLGPYDTLWALYALCLKPERAERRGAARRVVWDATAALYRECASAAPAYLADALREAARVAGLTAHGLVSTAEREAIERVLYTVHGYRWDAFDGDADRPERWMAFVDDAVTSRSMHRAVRGALIREARRCRS